jgi:hypothetical protein
MIDLKRIDMGIAMCHFELTAKELGLEGEWKREDPAFATADGALTYTASWVDG